MFLCESKSTLFGLPNVDAIRNHWLRFVYNRTANPNVRICATHFMDDHFVNLGEYKAGCAKMAKKKSQKKKKGQFRLCSENLVLLNQRLQVCFVIS